MKDLDPHKARRRKIRRIAIVEIIFMSLGVISVLLPLEWRLVALIALGARGIIVRAQAQMKEPIEPTEIETNGKNRKAAERGKTKKEQPRKKERGKRNGEVGVVGSYDNPNTPPKLKRKIETGAEKREERERKRGKAASSTKGTWE